MHPNNGKPRTLAEFLDECHTIMRQRQLSLATQKSYLFYIERFIRFHHRRPETMTTEHVRAFLRYLVLQKQVAASTQNVAFHAILFLYRHVVQTDALPMDAMAIDLGTMSSVYRARRPQRLPVVLSKHEVKALLSHLRSTPHLVASLLYGAGLRPSEALRLRIRDLDMERGLLTVRGRSPVGHSSQAFQGHAHQDHTQQDHKHRVTMVPQSLTEPLREHLAIVHRQWRQAEEVRLVPVSMPDINRRDTNRPDTKRDHFRQAPNQQPGGQPAHQWEWQFVFPSARPSIDPRDGVEKRYHYLPDTLQRVLKRAAREAGLCRQVSSHTLRHSFATRLLENGYDIRTVQELMGHKDVRTTMTYTHVLNRRGLSVRSPLDE